MEFVFIVGAVQALFLTFLVINKKNKSRGDFIMAALLFLMGLLLSGYTLEVMEIDTEFPIFLGFYTALPLLTGPLFYLYIVSYTDKEQRFEANMLLHALPFVFFTIAVFLKLTVYSEGSVIEDRDIMEEGKEPIFFIMGLFRIFHGTVYLIAGLVILRKHSKNITKHFSYTENIDLKWLRYVIGSIIILWGTVIIVNVLSNFNKFIPYRLGDNIIFLVVTVIVFLNGYYGIKQQIIFSPSASNGKKEFKGGKGKKKKQYLNSGLSQDESRKLLHELYDYMQVEKPYLDGKLSLRQLADKIDISPNHLSQVINENLSKNFFDFINGYRVNHVKDMMLDAKNSNLTLLGMAYESGFNSKSSFNSIFKKVSGSTPSQFMKSLSA